MNTLIITRENDVKVIKFNKPKKKNAIDCYMYIEAKKELDSAADDESISMVVLSGTGDFYCSGNELGGNNLKVDRELLLTSVKNFIESIILFPKLLVAVVNGPAVGIAATTLPFCDFVYASDKAYFYTPFTKLGLVAEACSSITFPQMMGDRLARKMLMLNYKMPAEEALECGLVTEVYKREELETKAWENIVNILKLPQDSLLATKKLLRRPYLRQFLETNDIEMQEVKRLAQKDLFSLLGTNPITGLSSDKAKELLAYYGSNTLTPATQHSWPLLLLKSLCTGFSVLIWLGAILCLTAYLIELFTKPHPSTDNLYLGCVLIAVDVICGLFSFLQNYKSSKIMKTFNSMIPITTNCVRDGVTNTETLVSNLVRGDIVHIKAGDVIPADLRIIDSKGFKVDNSSLTGECVAVPRSNTEGTPNIMESHNVAFFSALCVEGSATGVVICCGDLTALGRIAGLAARLRPAPSPLSREIHALMRYMSAWAIGLGLFIASASLALGYPFMQTTIFVIGIVVANIPEGLQPTVTASLTLTAKHMITKNCLVKNLEAMEALGACSTICSDKTGTLTENKMRVRHLWIGNQTYKVSNTSLDQLKDNKAFQHLKVCGALCSNASTGPGGNVQGDASEKAIFNFIFECDNPITIRKKYPKVTEIPFNSVNKYQVSVHLDMLNSRHILVMKGAPEVILERSSTVELNNMEAMKNKEINELINNAIVKLANTGERILAFADLSLDVTEYPPGYEFDSEEINFPTENLRFLGLVGLMDPPRKEVRSAIERVRAAGVRVMMVTGDHPATARAVAMEVGIATTPECHVITGTELRNMTSDLLYLTLEKNYEIVFARTSPTQKLQIVEACQRQGSVVAVTGDGVNDAPALRKADIGISMGITGSQVSKQTADIILMDDNFATIVTGIEEGRKIFDNLKKSICYILISNVPEIIPVLMFILFSIPLPLGVMTILCVDLGTDMWPAVSLAHEAAEQDVMARPPRHSDPLVSCSMIRLVYGHLGLIEFAAGMFAYFIVMAEHGFYPEQLFGIRQKWDNEAVSDVQDSLGQEWTYAERKELERACQAVYFVAIVMTQITNGIICKTRYNSIFHVGMKNKALSFGLVFEIILACIVCYVPGMNSFFRTYPLRLQWWFLALPFSLLMFIFDEFRKYCIRREKFGGLFNKLTFY